MKEYVNVPQQLLEDASELEHYFNLNYAYIGTLKPKPKPKPTAKEKKA
jgi:hypothetical protein